MQLIEKPLFIPLKSEFYEQFKSGIKRIEYRLYGPRWNEKTCFLGRKVILSKGYGKKDRMTRIISEFRKRDARTLQGLNRCSVLVCYGTLDKPIAEIGMLTEEEYHATT